MEMTIVIIDDQKSMLLILKKMLEKIPSIKIVGLFQNLKEAEDFLIINTVDMLFIDISMPEENGMSFAKRISEVNPLIEIVFVTSHKEYALEAFGMYAFDYMVKPVSQERLFKTVEKARNKVVNHEKVKVETNKMFINCLGGIDIKDKSGEVIQLFSSKSEELLAYLLVNRGKAVSKWSIIEDLFRGMPKNNAETYLNTTTYKLRKSFQPYGMKDVIICANGSYRIDIKDIYVDFIDFEKRVGCIGVIDTINITEAVEIENIFNGVLFGIKAYFWALSETQRLSLVHWGFAKQLSSKLIEQGNYNLPLKIIKKMEYENPLDEDINCLLMQFYADQKDRNALKSQYEKYKKILLRELDVLPEESTVNLYEKLKKSF